MPKALSRSDNLFCGVAQEEEDQAERDAQAAREAEQEAKLAAMSEEDLINMQIGSKLGAELTSCNAILEGVRSPPVPVRSNSGARVSPLTLPQHLCLP